MRRLRCIILTGAVFLAGTALPLAAAVAQSPFTPAQRDAIVQILREALKQDPTILRDAVVALQADDARRQEAATSSAIAAARATMVDQADPTAGNPRGDLTIVEFFDTRCPYCRAIDATVEHLLAQDHGVRLVYKDMPVLGLASMLGAKALLAAQRQEARVPGAYEKLRTGIMHGNAAPTEAGIRAEAEKIGLDWARLRHDMDDPEIQARLQRNISVAKQIGVRGTPGIVIGNSLVEGAVELAELQQSVAAARAAR